MISYDKIYHYIYNQSNVHKILYMKIICSWDLIRFLLKESNFSLMDHNNTLLFTTNLPAQNNHCLVDQNENLKSSP